MDAHPTPRRVDRHPAPRPKPKPRPTIAPAASWPAWTDGIRYSALPVRAVARAGTGKGVPG